MIKNLNQVGESSPEDQELLKQCETTIENGIKNFLGVGQALSTIRDKQLYRVKGYKTFEEYCQTKWQITRQYANRLVLAFRVEQELETIVSKPVLENPNQAKRFRGLDPDAQSAVKQSIANGTPIDEAITLAEKKQQPGDITKARQYATKLCQLLDQTADKDAMLKVISDLVVMISDYVHTKEKQEKQRQEDAEFERLAA